MPEPLDLVLAGGGLANGLIAWRLKTLRPELRVLLLEAGDALGGNHTWSFHDGDLGADERRWLAPLVAHRWPRHRVIFPGRSRTLDTGYASITSRRFDAVLRSELGDAVRLGASVAEVEPTRVRLRGGATIDARAAVDGRGVRPSRHLALGHQKFLGRELRLAVPHGLDAPVLMDASVAQDDGYRFVYLLPFSADTLLVEDTYYADGADVDAERLRKRIDAYCQRRGWHVAEVLREEHGVLPITLSGDAQAFWDDAGGVPRSGLAAGLFHPTTGYSLPEAARLADLIAKLPDLSAPALFAAVRAHALERWHGQAFFRLLNRMLFLAAEPGERWRVMQRFYGLSEPLVARFFAGRPTLADRLRILSGKPPVPLVAAFRAARSTRLHESDLSWRIPAQPQ